MFAARTESPQLYYTGKQARHNFTVQSMTIKTLILYFYDLISTTKF